MSMKYVLYQLWQSVVMFVWLGGFVIATFMRLDGFTYDEIIPVFMIYYVVLSVITVFVAAWWNNRKERRRKKRR